MKIGDKVYVEGVVHSLSESSTDIEVETCLGDVDYYPADKVRSDDKQIVVPEYVKNDLDKLFKEGRTSLSIAGVYWRSAPELTTETRRWIGLHGTAFMHALVFDYKVKTEKKYYVKVLKAESFYYWKISPNDAADLTVSTNTNSFSSDKQFTMDEIKKYGLEGCERVEVQDD